MRLRYLPTVQIDKVPYLILTADKLFYLVREAVFLVVNSKRMRKHFSIRNLNLIRIFLSKVDTQVYLNKHSTVHKHTNSNNKLIESIVFV